MATQHDPNTEPVDRWSFAETVESDGQARKPGVRLGPAIGAAAAAVIVVVAATVIPQLKNDPLGTTRGQTSPQQATTGQAAAGQAPAGQAPVAPPQTPQGGSGSLTYANHAIIGPGAGCCWTSGGAWSGVASGGYPAYGGPVRTSADPSAWYEWDLGSPAGGARWDQVKIRLWIPQGQAGAWVRVTVTSTAGGASNVASFDVPEQEYEGWYELPATFTIGTPDRRTGSAWVKMTYLRPYSDQAASQSCADGSCSRMAAAQAEFLWS